MLQNLKTLSTLTDLIAITISYEGKHVAHAQLKLFILNLLRLSLQDTSHVDISMP